MSGIKKGAILGALQLLLVLSLSGKLLYERATRPRVWVLAATYDPELPIRGRYLSQRLQFPADGFTYQQPGNRNMSDWFNNRQWVHLEVREGKLIGTAQGSGPGQWVYLHRNAEGSVVAFSQEPVLVFIPEKADVPILNRGEEMLVEVTIPKKGPPRPIRVGMKRAGVIAPLEFR
jgi:hypothetical protein